MRWWTVPVLCVGCTGVDDLPTGPIGEPAVLFGGDDFIYRYVDANGDGDYHDTGEQNLFFRTMTNQENFGSVFVVDQATLLVHVEHFTSTYPGSYGTLERLHDADGNGSAQDPGERTVWYTGPLPDGEMQLYTRAFGRAADGAVYITHTTRMLKDTVFRLNDVNADGDADDPGEATIVGSLPFLSGPSFALDRENRVWVYESTSAPANLYRFDSGALEMVFAGDEVIAETPGHIRPAAGSLVVLANGEPCFSGRWGKRTSLLDINWNLYAWRDRDADGAFGGDELVKAWDSSNGGGNGGNAESLEDGSLLISTSGLLRVADLDGDGAFSRAETRLLFDPAVATENGFEDTPPSRGSVR